MHWGIHWDAIGTRITISLLYEMIRSDVKYGLSTLGVGGGMGYATILENVSERR